MGSEKVLFKTEEKMSRSDVATLLRTLADKVEKGKVSLEQGKEMNGEFYVSKGIVCFCDILGYTSLLENNSMYSTVEIIVEQICEIKEAISCKISEFHKFSDSDRNLGRCFLKGKIKHLIVSDTIIFFFDMKDIEESKIERDFHTVPALITVQFILAFIREMFDRGLPLRGYVDYAEYCIFDHFFSGKVLADCHSESNKLDFSGVCMSKNCRDYLANGSNDQNFLYLLQSMIIEIEVPTKKGHEKRWLLN
jgi:hypothetical protein